MREIKRINSTDILNYAINFFPKFRLSKNPFEFIYAYFLDGVIIGFIDFSIIYEKAEVNYIAVDEKYRGMGVAQELFDKFVSIVKNVDTVSLEVSCNNERAINFYLKNDFTKEAIRQNYYDGADAYLMVKKMKVI